MGEHNNEHPERGSFTRDQDGGRWSMTKSQSGAKRVRREQGRCWARDERRGLEYGLGVVKGFGISPTNTAMEANIVTWYYQ